ncbi:unnamed protein product [Ectocarpus sp. CCAP 1310/34]|nr:unnamed protein product [Ectocarpus sp. CCAP 1310/34]
MTSYVVKWSAFIEYPPPGKNRYPVVDLPLSGLAPNVSEARESELPLLVHDRQVRRSA